MSGSHEIRKNSDELKISNLRLIIERVREAVAQNSFWKEYFDDQVIQSPPLVSVHLAVLFEPYLQYVLDGKKTIESRFSVRSWTSPARRNDSNVRRFGVFHNLVPKITMILDHKFIIENRSRFGFRAFGLLRRANPHLVS